MKVTQGVVSVVLLVTSLVAIDISAAPVFVSAVNVVTRNIVPMTSIEAVL